MLLAFLNMNGWSKEGWVVLGIGRYICGREEKSTGDYEVKGGKEYRENQIHKRQKED